MSFEALLRNTKQLLPNIYPWERLGECFQSSQAPYHLAYGFGAIVLWFS